ncbi:hypothetical protein QTH27_12765 [Clostridium perfringens]|nr:hypothetical protein [Clostridium perfringens]
MPKKLTLEEVKSFIEQNSDCRLISTEYVNNKSKLELRCGCGQTFFKVFNAFKNGQRKCNTCINRTYWDIDKINNFVKENSKCVLLSTEYNFKKTKLNFKCECGNEFSTFWTEFTIGNKRQCNDCGLRKQGESSRKTDITFRKEVFDLVKSEYSLLSKYEKSSLKVKFKHNNCGNVFLMTPNSFLRGQRCPKCSGIIKKTTEIFKQEIFSAVGHEYTLLGEYKSNRTKTLIRHNKCNYNWEVRPDDFLKGQRCPKCQHTKGEQVISKWLDDNNFNYKSQYRIKECRNKRPLPFDFAIFDRENELKLLVEYDGLLHFKKTTLNNDLKQQQLHDKIKNCFCKENKIELLRIPYWEFNNIENILESALK